MKNVVTIPLDLADVKAVSRAYRCTVNDVLMASAAGALRSYLIDRGVKSRIEVGAFAGDGERVDILVPNT